MQRFNSGVGGYTCDGCSILLWSGFGGLEDESTRYYCYGATKDDVQVKEGKAYCKDCK